MSLWWAAWNFENPFIVFSFSFETGSSFLPDYGRRHLKVSASAAPDLASLIHRTIGQASRPSRGYLSAKRLCSQATGSAGSYPSHYPGGEWSLISPVPTLWSLLRCSLSLSGLPAVDSDMAGGWGLGNRGPGSGSTQSRLGIRRENSQLCLI